MPKNLGIPSGRNSQHVSRRFHLLCHNEKAHKKKLLASRQQGEPAITMASLSQQIRGIFFQFSFDSLHFCFI
jgi:hypothetical protein